MPLLIAVPSSIGEERHQQRSFCWFFFILLLLFSLNTLYQYLGAGRDDVFITLWAGKTLGTAPWFINYNSELQEISSSILGALIAKFAYVCCVDAYYLANKLLGGGAALATLSILWFQRDIFFRLSPDASAIVAAALLGFNSSFAYWSLGGLETPYYALLILLYAALAIRLVDPVAPASPTVYLIVAFVQILALLCRPEGFWLIGITATLLVLYWTQLPDRRRRIFQGAIIPPLLVLIALFAVRYALTGAIFPNSVYAKVSVSHLGGLREGWNYLIDFMTISLASLLLGGTTVIAAAIVGYAVLKKMILLLSTESSESTENAKNGKHPAILDGRWLVPALCICGYDVFIILVKGDWMEYHRFLAPTLALKTVLLIQTGATCLALTPFVSVRRWVSIAVMVILVLVVIDEWRYRSPQDCSTRLVQEVLTPFLDHPNDATMALNCTYQRDHYAIRPFIDHELPKRLAQQGHLTILTYQGGYFPYFIRERFPPHDVAIVDTTGLLNLDIARVGGEKIPTGNKHLGDIPAILGGEIPGLSEKVSRYHPNMVYMLGEKEADHARFKTMGFERILQEPGAVVYLKSAQPAH